MPAFWQELTPARVSVTVEQAGTVLLSKRVENDENALFGLNATVPDLADGGEVVWATDLIRRRGADRITSGYSL
jgi:hypothetical protein